MSRESSKRNHSTVIGARIVLTTAVAIATAGLISYDAFGSDAGVTDYSGAQAAVIEVGDITTALAVPRGTRIEPAAPPTVRLPIFFEFNSTKLRPEAQRAAGQGRRGARVQRTRHLPLLGGRPHGQHRLGTASMSSSPAIARLP